MSVANKEAMYWHKNKDWYIINEKKQLELTNLAPERAKKSFEMWKKINSLK